MADLGTLQTFNRSNLYAYKLSVWQATNAGLSGAYNRSNPYRRFGSYTRGASNNGAPIGFLTEYDLGTFSGAVTENGSPVANAVVVVFDRRSCIPVGRTMSDASGNFTFTNIYSKSFADFFVVAFDPEGGVSYNALVFDKLQAV